MGQSRTNGFDIVVEISEQELNDQLVIMYANGDMPQEVILTFNLSGMTLVADLLFDRPSIDLHSDVSNGVVINMPFNYSALEITSPSPSELKPLAGNIEIRDRISVVHEDNLRSIVIDFAGGIDQVNVSFTPETEQKLTNAGISPSIARTVLKQEVEGFLQNDVQEITIDERTVELGDESPFTINELDVAVINDESRINGDCVAYLLSTSSTTNGDSTAFTQCAIPSGRRAAIVISNDLLLGRVMCPQLVDALRQAGVKDSKGELISEDDFRGPCELRRQHYVQGVTIKTLTATIQNGYIRISGTFAKSGTGYSASGSFTARIYLELREGQIEARIEIDEPEVEVDIDWWVYVAGAFSVGAFTGTITDVIGIVLVGAVDAIIDGLAAGMFDDILSENMSDMSIPLGDVAEGFNLEGLILDDLILYGSPIRSGGMEIFSQGDVELLRGENVNLETGEVWRPEGGVLGSRGFWFDEYGNMMIRLADLGWEETYLGLGIWPQGIARMKPVGGYSFDLLTPIEIEHAFAYHEDVVTYEEGFIPSTSIPVGTEEDHDVLLIAVRTGNGRYAKCAVWRESWPKLHVGYVTYTSGYISPGPEKTTTRRSIFEAHPALRIAFTLKEKARGEEEYIGLDIRSDESNHLDYDEDITGREDK